MFHLKIFRLCLCFVFVISLCGCWSSRELDGLAIIMGIGIENDGDKIKCCTQVIVPQNAGAGKEGGSKKGSPYVNYVTKEKHLSTCINKVSDLTGKTAFMSHNLIMVVGEDIAKEGIYRFLDYFMRNNELRFNVSLLVTDENVEKVLSSGAELSEIPSITISKISSELSQNFAGQNVTVINFIENMMSKQKGSIVPLVRCDEEDKTKLIIQDAAIFSDDKMVGKLNEKELRGALWLLGNIKGGDVILNIDENSLSLRVGRIKCKTEPKFGENGDISFNAKVSADLYLVRDDANIIEIIGMDAALEELNKSVEKEINDSLLKIQDMGVDIFGFGDMIYRKNPKAWYIIDDNWTERYKKTPVNVTADCRIIETGSIIGSVRNSEANLN